MYSGLDTLASEQMELDILKLKYEDYIFGAQCCSCYRPCHKSERSWVQFPLGSKDFFVIFPLLYNFRIHTILLEKLQLILRGTVKALGFQYQTIIIYVPLEEW